MSGHQAGNKQPRRILHVVGRMDRGGIERWLIEVFRRSDQKQFAHEVVVREPGRHAFFPELESLHIPIHFCPGHPNPLAFGRSFLRLLRQGQSVAVVHSHLDLFTGLVMLLARMGGVPSRIAHIHNDYSLTDQTAGWSRRAYVALIRWLVARHATLGLAVSESAAVYLFGADWRQQPARAIVPAGIDLLPLRLRRADPLLRHQLAIPPSAWVIGTTGRLVPQKNQMVLIEAMSELLLRIPHALLVIAGAGPLKDALATRAAELGVSHAVALIGSREDVPNLLVGVFDVFVFPSLFEGLGLSVIEAQAAGLPCLISTAVPDLAVFAAAKPVRLSPTASSSAWAAAIAELAGVTIDHEQVWTACAASPLAIDHGVAALANCHQ